MLIHETRGGVNYQFFRPRARRLYLVIEPDERECPPARARAKASDDIPPRRGKKLRGGTTMLNRIGAQPEHGFDEPLGLMADCHRRIEHFLGVLEKVAQAAVETALSDEHRRAVQTALTYFDIAAPRHTADEEQSLFPRLRETEDPGARQACDKLAALEADHARGDALHAQIKAHYLRWLADGSLSTAARGELAESLRCLRELYREHIAIEESDVFPLAGAVLSSSQLAQVGQEMARRRGLSASMR